MVKWNRSTGIECLVLYSLFWWLMVIFLAWGGRVKMQTHEI